MTTLLVEVTQDDIDKGVQQMADRCPIALAVKRLVGPDYVLVEPSSVRVQSFEDDNILYGELPPEAHTFVIEFDNGGEVHPITFETELTDSWRTL